MIAAADLLAARGLAREQIARHRGGKKAQRGVEHGDIDMLALPRALCLQLRGTYDLPVFLGDQAELIGKARIARRKVRAA